jgi:hypothetical protein
MQQRLARPISLWIAFSTIVGLFAANLSFAGVSPADPYEASALPVPNPDVFAWNSAIAYYDGNLIYAGNDGQIYAFEMGTNVSTVVCDTSALSTLFSSVTGFLVGNDHYLYFHDNGNTKSIYRVRLTDDWPARYESFDTQCNGFIYAFTKNPWTGAIWFSSADFGPGNMYLYEVGSSFDRAVERAAFSKPHGENAGNGPVIFKGQSTLLYGESVWGENGYFHLVDSTAGSVIEKDYITFSGGLAGAAYGYDNVIYVTTGGGKKIYQIDGADKIEVAATTEDAQVIVFDGFSFYVSEQKSSDWSGAISLHALWHSISIGVPAGQEAPKGMVEGEVAVITQGSTGNKAVGISAADDFTFVELVKAIDPNTINEDTNRPDRLPFGLIDFRLKVTSPDGIATVTVYLSEEAPADAVWYKYNSINGWHDYSDHARLSADARSFSLEFKDGGYGDADGIVNGYITDPGAVAATSASSSDTDGEGVTSSPPGGGAGGCFVCAGFDGSAHMGRFLLVLFSGAIILGCSVCAFFSKNAAQKGQTSRFGTAQVGRIFHELKRWSLGKRS